MSIITVEQAEYIIQSQNRDYGTEQVNYESAVGRILAENLLADRDLPPFDRATVDGFAIDFDTYAAGQRTFRIKATQAAGETPVSISEKDECIEIMTGAAVDGSVNTVVRYEDTDVTNQMATVKNIEIKRGQNVHRKGQDKTKGSIVATAGCIITPALVGLAAAVGKTTLQTKKLPKIAVISTGDEIVSETAIPGPYQIRRSNGMMLKSALAKYQVAADILHLKDDLPLIKKELGGCLERYDALLITGGVSMGKFDYVPQALESLGVKMLFHKIKQRPGKPFWFGTFEAQKLIFAFPGNPVSGFMCLHRYFIPWLKKSLGDNSPFFEYAALQNDICFPKPLQYFAQAKLTVTDGGLLTARTLETNGSGDFSNLVYTDAFLELPLEKNDFKRGEIYKIWRYQ
jgi:molybdopterin molybdotransferase